MIKYVCSYCGQPISKIKLGLYENTYFHVMWVHENFLEGNKCRGIWKKQTGQRSPYEPEGIEVYIPDYPGRQVVVFKS